MTPEQRLELENLRTELDAIKQALDPVFVRAIMRSVKESLTVSDLPAIKLSDLSDVSGTDSATTGQEENVDHLTAGYRY